MTLYQDKVIKYGPRFMKDLGLTREQVAGLFGNFYAETGGFTLLQEQKPLVKGSRGGYGWAQWTGPRRKAYEAWAKANNLDVSADETNYQYVVYELKGPEANALRLLKLTTTPKAAAETVSAKYERPGIPHMDTRIKGAEMANTYLQNSASAKTTAAVIVTTGTVATASTVTAAQAAGYSWGGIILAAAVIVGIFSLLTYLIHKGNETDVIVPETKD